ncbi:hypothetical protein HDU85_007490 [Gaertneriomyces sp. JEL0708]|nr:hypothetical protein HDU85_007490 [Gaertneriomyces sp. JEL0708]
MPSAKDSVVLGNTPVHSDDDGGPDVGSVAADRLTDLNRSPTPSRFSHAFSIASESNLHDDDIHIYEEETWAPVPSDMDLQSTKAAESMAWDAFLNGSGIPESPTSHTPSTSSPSRNNYTKRSFSRETPTGSPFTIRTKPEIEKTVPCNVPSPCSSILMTRREAQVNQMLDAEVHTMPLEPRPIAQPPASGLELIVHRRLHHMETLMAQLVQDNRDLKQVVLAASQRLEAALRQRMADKPPTSDSEDGHPADDNLTELMIDNGLVQSNGTREQHAGEVEFAGATASDPAENGYVAIDRDARTSSPEAEMQIEHPAEDQEMPESSGDCGNRG